MWVSEDETMASILDLHEESAAHSDATIDALPLDAMGTVPWWPAERREVTLQQILVHMCVETARHAGHADIVRELIDGRTGATPNDPNLPTQSEEEWTAYRDRIESAARAATGRA
jgi:hypothetical protein